MAASLLATACAGAPQIQAPPPAPPVIGVEKPVAASAPGTEGPTAVALPEIIPDALTRAVADHLGRMSLEQKIGQRFLSFVPGTVMGEKTRAAISRHGFGGVVLNFQNIKTGDQLRRLVAELQGVSATTGVGLFVAVDQEGGRVARLQLPEITRLPPASRWADHRDPRYVESVAYVTATEIRRLGCNMNLAPVLDLYTRSDDTVIGDRSFGSDPELAGTLGAAYVRASREAGVLAVVKHFPGHGETVVDSHRTLPVVSTSAEELRGRVVAPFRAAIRAGAEAVMTAHVLYPGQDPTYPATMSRRIVEELLRGELGFEGIVVSDAIEMGALAEAGGSRSRSWWRR